MPNTPIHKYKTQTTLLKIKILTLEELIEKLPERNFIIHESKL